MAVPRFIVVDDTDTSIQYIGPWFQDYSGSQNGNGHLGQIYQNTMHGTNSNANITFSFSGTAIRVWGTTNVENISIFAGHGDPSWQCFVDDISISTYDDSPFTQNNWLLCGQEQLTDGVHALTVNVTVLQTHTFWLDKIDYAPSLSVPLDGKAILVDNTDPQLQTAFDSTWSVPTASDIMPVNQTQIANATFTYNFTGVSLSWFGINPVGPPELAATGIYMVDQDAPTRFFIRSLPASAKTIEYNQLFFQTPQFVQGSHQLVVQFEGNQTTVPLTLDYIIIYNGSTISASASSFNASYNGSSSRSSCSMTPSSTIAVDDPSRSTIRAHDADHTHNVNIATIVGIVVAGVALVVIVTWLILRYKMRQRRRVSTQSPHAFPFFHTNIIPAQKLRENSVPLSSLI